MTAAITPVRDAAAELVARSTRASGVPEHVRDPAVLASIAELLRNSNAAESAGQDAGLHRKARISARRHGSAGQRIVEKGAV
jgi:hypothetical protein